MSKIFTCMQAVKVAENIFLKIFLDLFWFKEEGIISTLGYKSCCAYFVYILFSFPPADCVTRLSCLTPTISQLILIRIYNAIYRLCKQRSLDHKISILWCQRKANTNFSRVHIYFSIRRILPTRIPTSSLHFFK